MSPELIQALSTGGPIAVLSALAITWVVKVILPWQREALASNASRIGLLEARVQTLEDEVEQCHEQRRVDAARMDRMAGAMIRAGVAVPD